MGDENMDLLNHTIEKMAQDIQSLKGTDDKHEERLKNLETTVLLHDKDIKTVLESLGEIKGDLKWVRRTISASLIMAVLTGIITLIVWAATH